MRIDDAIVRWCGAEVEVSIGDARVGALDVEDSARYAAVLRQADCGIETSGMVLIDAAGHPGATSSCTYRIPVGRACQHG